MKTVDGNIDNRLLKHLYKTRYRKLIKLIVQVLPNFDREVIHQFRVNYKKFRAFLRMIIQLHESDTEAAIPKRIKKIYHASGVLRDLQMQESGFLELAKKKNIKPAIYLKYLRNKSDDVKRILTWYIVHTKIGKYKKKKILAFPAEFQMTGFIYYVENLCKKVHTILYTGFLLDKDLHTIRKLLKDLLYNLEILDKKVQEFILKKYMNGRDLLFINELLQQLGELQDKCTAIYLLKSYRRYHLSDHNEQLLDPILLEWIEEKVYLKQEIIKRLKSDLTLI